MVQVLVARSNLPLGKQPVSHSSLNLATLLLAGHQGLHSPYVPPTTAAAEGRVQPVGWVKWMPGKPHTKPAV